MKRMLFNATQAEELRVAIVDGQKLIDLDIESAGREQRKSNIYKGVITRIEPSLEAAFVDYGAERHGFLPFKEISRSYFQANVEPGRASIKEALHEGQELIVQVDKDERGNKGAALTTFISLAGRYLVLMPNNPRGGGVSRRVEGEERAELRELLDQLQVPQGMSLIARTAAIGRSTEELQWDLNYLLQLWKAIDGATSQQKGAFLIYQEGSLVIRAIRDYFQPDIGEILIDTDEIYEQARQFMEHVMPATVGRIKRYRDDVPLFSRFQIEHQIESAYSRQVGLPSGGAIVIDHTEALVSVDVNSGRSTRGSDIEETALKTNLEAAEEVARQLRLRDLGGLIVIDFIDMENQRSQREVELQLRDSLRFDRARVQTGKISRFGMMELSRQRLRPALSEDSYIACPRCSGTGHIRNTESAALHILRVLEEEAMKDNTGAVHVQMPVDVATFLLNEKRQDIQAIELRHKVSVLLIPNIHLVTPQHTITRLRHEELNHDEPHQPSYKMMEVPEDEVGLPQAQKENKPARQEAAIKGITHTEPAPIVAEKSRREKPEEGFFSTLVAWISSLFSEKEESEASRKKSDRKPHGSVQQRDARRNRNNNRRNDSRNEPRTNRENKEQQPAAGNREQREPRQTQTQTRGEKTREPRKPRGEGQNERNERKDMPVTNQQAAAQAKRIEPAHGAPEKSADEHQGNGQQRRRGRRGSRKERPETALPVEAGQTVQATQLASERPMPVEHMVKVVTIDDEAAAMISTDEIAIESSMDSKMQQISLELGSVETTQKTVLPTPVPTFEQPLTQSTNIIANQAIDIVLDTKEDEAEESPVMPASVQLTIEPPAPPVIVADVPVSLPPVEKKPEPVVEQNLEKVLQDSGLVMIETQQEKIVERQSEEPTAPAKTRARRKRSVQASQNEEPLVMVETSKAD